MSAVLKSTGMSDIRPILGLVAHHTDIIAIEPVSDPRDDEIARLQARLIEAESALALAEANAKAGIERASEAGRRAGREAATRDDAARVAALEHGIAAAHKALEGKLATLDALAPAVARIALDKLLGASEARTDLVAAMIARNLAAFRRDVVIAISVSAQDFPDLSVADSLLGAATVRSDPDLASGSARIDARLERLDLDLDAEWARIAMTLDSMATGT